MKHLCHRPGCTKEVAPRLLACRGHWFELPRALRDAIWEEYRPGQENDKDPSAAYMQVFDRCQEFWKRKDADLLSAGREGA